MGRPGVKLARLAEDDLLTSESMDASINSLLAPEARYSSSTPLIRRKRYGQFFTPESVADLMADWVSAIKPKRIIDPAVGTGIFVRSLNKILDAGYKIDCYDIDPLVVSYIEDTSAGKGSLSVHVVDFLTASINSQKYDAAIMNPPYLRHHDLCYSFDIHDRISNLTNHKISKLANAYVLFVMRTCELLREGGRAAFIIPTEWTNANFGQPFKEYLLGIGGLKHIIYFSNCSDVFADALTTACILLIEKTPLPTQAIDVTFVEGATTPFLHRTIRSLNKEYSARKVDAKTLKESTKWDHIMRNGSGMDLPGFIRLGTLGKSKRGIATGANDFFHIPKTKADEIGISSRHLIPCIGRAADVEGFVFTKSNYKNLVLEGKRSELISFSDQLSKTETIYIRQGEADGIDKRYLLSKRTPWYSMEDRKPAPIWAAVFGRDGLRFIHNQALISNLTTFHGFYPYETTTEYVSALTATLNSKVVQEAARAHIRVYGGGLLKFEPNDLLDIQVPNLMAVSSDIIAGLANCLKEQSNRSLNWKELDRLVYQAADAASNKAP